MIFSIYQSSFLISAKHSLAQSHINRKSFGIKFSSLSMVCEMTILNILIAHYVGINSGAFWSTIRIQCGSTHFEMNSLVKDVLQNRH